MPGTIALEPGSPLSGRGLYRRTLRISFHDLADNIWAKPTALQIRLAMEALCERESLARDSLVCDWREDFVTGELVIHVRGHRLEIDLPPAADGTVEGAR